MGAERRIPLYDQTRPFAEFILSEAEGLRVTETWFAQQALEQNGFIPKKTNNSLDLGGMCATLSSDCTSARALTPIDGQRLAQWKNFA